MGRHTYWSCHVGKRTLRTLHFEMVAERIFTQRRKIDEYEPSMKCRESALRYLNELTLAFADEFEIRAENFQRDKFLKMCGLEEGK